MKNGLRFIGKKFTYRKTMGTTWSLSGSDSTVFTGHTDVGNITNHVKILFLDATHLTMFDSTYHTYAANVAKY